MISAGAVAKEGIARKIGDRNSDSPKRIAVVTDVRPVLPPSDTPDALSTNVVVVDVPLFPESSDHAHPFLSGSIRHSLLLSCILRSHLQEVLL